VVHDFCEADTSSASRKNTPPFMEQKGLYRLQKSLLLVSIPSQINPVDYLGHYFSKTSFNIILPCMPNLFLSSRNFA